MTIHLVIVLPISCTFHFMKKCVTFENLKYLVVLVENVQEHRTERERWEFNENTLLSSITENTSRQSHLIAVFTLLTPFN